MLSTGQKGVLGQQLNLFLLLASHFKEEEILLSPSPLTQGWWQIKLEQRTCKQPIPSSQGVKNVCRESTGTPDRKFCYLLDAQHDASGDDELSSIQFSQLEKARTSPYRTTKVWSKQTTCIIDSPGPGQSRHLKGYPLQNTLLFVLFVFFLKFHLNDITNIWTEGRSKHWWFRVRLLHASVSSLTAPQTWERSESTGFWLLQGC